MTILQFQDMNGQQRIYVDPSNVSNRVTALVKASKKNVGGTSLRNVVFDSQQTRAYKYVPCKDKDCGVSDLVYARVILTGANPAEIALAWADLKTNVEAFLALKVLEGVNPPLVIDNLVSTPTPSV